MANEPDDSTVVAGDGPGAGYVQLPGIIALAAYLLVFTLGLIWELHAFWPSCDPTTLNSSTSASAKPAETPGAKPETSPGGAGSQTSLPFKLDRVDPAKGSTEGKEVVTLSGTGFKVGAVVLFGDTSSPKADVESSSKITAVTPRHVLGKVEVKVTNPGGTSANLPDGYTYEAASAETANKPANVVQVLSVLPKSGDVNGGTPVKIAGNGFLDKPTVKFGGSAATDVQMESTTSISAKTPPHSEGAVDVTVTNTDTSTNTLSSGYTYDTCLAQCRSRLLLLVLLAGALGGCFHALRSLWMFVGNRDLKRSWALMYIALPINGAVLAFIFFIVISAGSGFFAQPAGSNSCFWIIGIAALVGLFSQQAAETLKKIAEAVFTGVPKKADPLSGGVSITSIVPAQGPLAGGTPVIITGKGFTNTGTVTFGGVAGTNFKFVSPSSISVVTPPGKELGPVDVMVTDPGSNAKAVKPGGFTYSPPTEPPSDGLSITSIDPATGPLAGGTTVTITGKGFTNTSTVTFGGEPGAKLKLGSPTSISVDTPPGKQPGPVDVIVADTASKAQDTKAGGFTYTAS